MQQQDIEKLCKEKEILFRTCGRGNLLSYLQSDMITYEMVDTQKELLTAAFMMGIEACEKFHQSNQGSD